MRRRFNYVPYYGRLWKALLDGIWPDNFREQVVAEALVWEISFDPELL